MPLRIYSGETLKKTEELIKDRFGVTSEQANNLAMAALSGIWSHGGDPNDFKTITATIEIVVASWINNKVSDR